MSEIIVTMKDGRVFTIKDFFGDYDKMNHHIVSRYEFVKKIGVTLTDMSGNMVEFKTKQSYDTYCKKHDIVMTQSYYDM